MKPTLTLFTALLRIHGFKAYLAIATATATALALASSALAQKTSDSILVTVPTTMTATIEVLGRGYIHALHQRRAQSSCGRIAWPSRRSFGTGLPEHTRWFEDSKQ